MQTIKNKKEAPLKQALVTQAAKTDEKTHADMQIQFNCAMFIAKEELPFTKYRPLLELHMKNGMDISATYASGELETWKIGHTKRIQAKVERMY